MLIFDFNIVSSIATVSVTANLTLFPIFIMFLIHSPLMTEHQSSHHRKFILSGQIRLIVC